MFYAFASFFPQAFVKGDAISRLDMFYHWTEIRMALRSHM